MGEARDSPPSRRVLRLIALERAVRGLILFGAGIYLLTHLGSDLGKRADRIIRHVELDPKRPFLHRIVEYLHHLHASQVRIVGAAAVGYGELELVEAAASGATDSGRSI
jgi:hypothetical protein